MQRRYSGKLAEREGRGCNRCHRNGAKYIVDIKAAVDMRAELCIRCTDHIMREHPASVAVEIQQREQ